MHQFSRWFNNGGCHYITIRDLNHKGIAESETKDETVVCGVAATFLKIFAEEQALVLHVMKEKRIKKDKIELQSLDRVQHYAIDIMALLEHRAIDAHKTLSTLNSVLELLHDSVPDTVPSHLVLTKMVLF